DGDEGRRLDGAEIAIRPPCKRFETDDLARLEVDDRLEMRLYLAARYGPAKGLLDACDALGGFLHFLREDHHAAATGAFGLIERRLRLVEQEFGRLVSGRKQRTSN